MSNVNVSRHPLVLHNLTLLRSTKTDPPAFRALVRELTRLLFYEATNDLRLEHKTVHTPLAEYKGHQIAERIGLMPILRAGLGMAEALIDVVPSMRVGT